MKLGWRGLLGVAISALLIWWTLKDVSIPEVWAVMRTGNLWLLGAAVFVATFGFLVRAFRWQVLLRPLNPNTSLDSRFGAITIGFMANNLLPARVGEFVRVYALSRMEAVTMSGALGTLVVERVLDGVVLLLFLVLPVLLPGFPAEAAGNPTVRALIGSALLALAAILVVLIVLLVWPAAVVRTVERVLARLPGGSGRRAVDALEAFLDALQIVRRPGLLLLAVLWSVGFWAFHGTSFYLAMAAFDIHEGFMAALFTEAAVGFGVAVPSAPGFFGTFHAAASGALVGVYRVESARALAFAYGYHLGGFIPVTLIGLWYARRVGLSLSDMGRSETRVERDEEAKHPEAGELLRAQRIEDAAERRARHTGRGTHEVELGRVDGPGRGGSAVAQRGRGSRSAAVDRPGGPHGSAVELDAPAKVNLFLRVGDRERDGYHGLVTLFQALELSDRLRVELVPRDEITLDATGLDAGPPEDNLVRRAARAFLEAAGGGTGIHCRLEKRIPAGGGLGGGSSDAAATLRALDALLPLAVSAERLREIAARLGSDVPFFLGGSALALGEGRGEKLTPVAALPAAAVILALPDSPVPTAWAYRALDEQRAASGRTARAERAPSPAELESWDAVARLARNDFEDVVPGSHARVALARESLLATRPLLALLAGSGSSSFAVYRSEADARQAYQGLPRLAGVRFLRTRTLAALPAPAGAAAEGAHPRG